MNVAAKLYGVRLSAQKGRLVADLVRGQPNQPGPIKSLNLAEGVLSSAMGRFQAIVEAYPELKADAQFQNLHRELVNTEDRIQAARRFYNGNVRDYRNKCESFPSSIVASMFAFQPASFFEVEPAVRVAPQLAGSL